MPMLFPYDRYETLNEPFTIYYPASEEVLARQVTEKIDLAGKRLSNLLHIDLPDFEVLLVDMEDWPLVPHSESEEVDAPHPYITDLTTPPTLVVPTELDPIFGDITPEKFAFMLYHELTVAYLEDDPRPWPEVTPLWADEWQFKFIALWLSQQLDGVQGVVNKDLHEQYSEAFEPEADGKTPVTVRGFDWYDDTTPEEYLTYELLLEQLASDLLARYDISLIQRFLNLYRTEQSELLSDQVTNMLVEAIGPQSEEWLEELVYF
ncbi:hypothetical protein [Dictyobacter aurantiacus]|uniref:Uncharacterized protein n=1 Tax=Dictyobacter aurantiacus TaxID=1936993 RepID=A0A401Z7P9_9CHLR|nr:hypothetical protein [Dictyobacter aurantiacus]GCE02873.1 hypothetical protein KDAU_02020 [Dictyobacter aurantiacus]